MALPSGNASPPSEEWSLNEKTMVCSENSAGTDCSIPASSIPGGVSGCLALVGSTVGVSVGTGVFVAVRFSARVCVGGAAELDWQAARAKTVSMVVIAIQMRFIAVALC